MRLCVVLSAVLACSVAFGDDEREMHDILSENFRACNEEDVDALMETCSVDMPDREGFRTESEILFREKDIYYRLEDFRVTFRDGDYAEAWVVQRTITGDRTSDSDRREFFRNGTTLLPRGECVEYRVAFKRDGRRWKCLATISEPVSYREPAAAR